MKRDHFKDVILGTLTATAILTAILMFSPMIAWIGTTFLGY